MKTLLDDSYDKMLFRSVGVEILRNEGIDALTVRRVVSMSGKSNGSFYNCYKTKDDLLEDIFRNNTKRLAENLRNNYDEKYDEKTNLHSAIRFTVKELSEVDKSLLKAYVGSELIETRRDNPMVIFFMRVLEKGIERGYFKDFDVYSMSYSLSIYILSVILNYAGNDQSVNDSITVIYDYLELIMNQIEKKVDKKDYMERLVEVGVDIENGFARFSGKKDIYFKFLKEFFTDEYFDNCRDALEKQDVEAAFDYAHGLKGLAGTLSINNVYTQLETLVEILRRKSLAGAMDTYQKTMEECRKVTEIIETIEGDG